MTATTPPSTSAALRPAPTNGSGRGCTRQSRDDGMTLIEVLLALVLTAIVSGAVFSALLVFSEVAKGNEAEAARLAADQVRATSIIPSDLRNATYVQVYDCGNRGQIGNGLSGSSGSPALCEENFNGGVEEYDEWFNPATPATNPPTAHLACSEQSTNSWGNSWPAMKLMWQDLRLAEDPDDGSKKRTWTYQHEVKYTLEENPLPGLRGQYFTGVNGGFFSGRADVLPGPQDATTRQDAVIDIGGGAARSWPDTPDFAPENGFGVRWDGNIAPLEDGSPFTLRVQAKGHVRVWVGDIRDSATGPANLIINSWNPGDAADDLTLTGVVDAADESFPTADGGDIPIRIEYFSPAGTDDPATDDDERFIRLSWKDGVVAPGDGEDAEDDGWALVPESKLSGGGNCALKRIERVRRSIPRVRTVNGDLESYIFSEPVKLTSMTIADNLAPNRTLTNETNERDEFVGPMTVIYPSNDETTVVLNQVLIKSPTGETLTDFDARIRGVKYNSSDGAEGDPGDSAPDTGP